ncbi:MAG: SxtJ family membrane protein [Ignavibacteria bacterium]|nr:SxtJ family membrane protein [Ignavibacteria bacterium]
MSLIKDVRYELSSLKLDNKTLRGFSFVVGGVLGAICCYFAFIRHSASLFLFIGAGAASLLVLTGLIIPRILRSAYIIWMTAAFVMGWVISRVLVIAIFSIFVIPVGYFMRLAGKQLMDIQYPGPRASYWHKRESGKKTDYDTLY